MGLDFFGIIEIAIIFLSLYAIYKYSLPTTEVQPPTTLEDFKIQMLQYIDKKLGPVQKTPHGLLKKDFVLHL
jgi:hypothetical protein